MYIGTQELLKQYDAYLLEHGHTIEELVDLASDALFGSFTSFNNLAILVGPGNNGADGLSLGLKLKEIGKKVTYYYTGDIGKLSEANRYYREKCDEGSLIYVDEENLNSIDWNIYDCIVDAFFGFGLNSAPRGMYKRMIERINTEYLGQVGAIDIPTGLNCNTGKAYDGALKAHFTITLTAIKQGFINPQSIDYTGKVYLKTLKVGDCFKEAGLFEIADMDYAKEHLRERNYYGYKNIYGVDGLIVGSNQYTGAPLLATKAAYYTGAGIVKTLTTQKVADALPLYIPEAIPVVRPDIFHYDDFDGYDALLIGSGLGLEESSFRAVIDIMTASICPLVLDGDALTIISRNMHLLEKQDRPIILTPHIGEFKRLCNIDEYPDLMIAARSFAQKYHLILVLKGPRTIVTDGHTSYRVASGNKAMAVGGMGDTLAGIITSLVGQGYEAIDAAVLGVYIHGKAGDEVAKSAYTVIPEKLIDEIPHVMAEIIENKQKSLMR